MEDFDSLLNTLTNKVEEKEIIAPHINTIKEGMLTIHNAPDNWKYGQVIQIDNEGTNALILSLNQN